MSIYASLPKLGRIQLPSGTTYALTDADLRLMIAPAWAAGNSYKIGDYVRYDSAPYTPSGTDPFHASDDFYKCIEANSDTTWTAAKWEKTTVADELLDIWGSITSAINYKGKTTTSLKDGATINPIIINGQAVTATPGDLVIETPPTYTASTVYTVGEYFTKDGVVYQVEQDFTSPASGDLPSSDYWNIATSEPEFIFDGTTWSEFGAFNPAGLGDLAYKDSASGTYTKPTGSGSVSVPTVTANKQKLSTTTVTGVNGTVNASLVSYNASNQKTFATAAADTVEVALPGETVKVGNADVGAAVGVGTALGGTTTFVTSAINSVTLGTDKTFNTDAIKSASLTGTTTFATSGITSSVSGDCLTFGTAGTGTVGITTASATTKTVSITTGTAPTASVTLTTQNITPAKAVSNTSTVITPVGSSQVIRPVGGTADALTSLSITPVTPAKAAASATTVATGGLEAGDQIVSGVTIGTATATVTVGTTTDTITVR